MSLTLVLTVVLVALVFEYINGFHDTANSIATVVATKVLSPGQAVLLAACTNLIGALWGTAVAKTISSGLIDSDVVAVTPQVLICALLGATIWDLITWWWGLPSSSSHALIGGLVRRCARGGRQQLVGADLVAGRRALVGRQGPAAEGDAADGECRRCAGFLLGFTLMGAAVRADRRCSARVAVRCRSIARPRTVNAFFGKAQILSASAMGLSHGTNDAQKTMGIIALALAGATTAGIARSICRHGFRSCASPRMPTKQFEIAIWIKVTCAIGDGGRHDGGRLAHHPDARPQDGEAASDQRLRRGDRFGHGHPHGVDTSAFRCRRRTTSRPRSWASARPSARTRSSGPSSNAWSGRGC